MLSLIRMIIFRIARIIVKIRYHDSVVLMARIKARFGVEKSIISIESGARKHENNNYAMFLIYQPNQISWYVKNAIDSLNEAGVNIVAIVNHSVDEVQLSYLKENCRTIITRNNSGFDMGAFRDATLYLDALPLAIDRVIYLNDSIYFFKKGLTDLFRRLIGSKSDICAPFENWEIHYHIQSFCLSISGRIFKEAAFQKFWRDYLPVNSRLWAINRGEVGLSRTMVPLAKSIDIIYKPNNIRGSLTDIKTLDSRLNVSRLIPMALRSQSSEICSLTQPEVSQFFISKIAIGSPVHTGGFVYRKYNACPLMKRDLLYRDQFSVDEIEEALTDIGHEGHFEEIMTDFRKKGKASQLPLIKRLQAASGII